MADTARHDRNPPKASYSGGVTHESSPRVSVGSRPTAWIGEVADRILAHGVALRSRRAKALLVALILFGAAGCLLWTQSWTYPPKLWMFPTYAQAWGLALLFHASCLVAGWQVLRLVIELPVRLLERLVLAHACGVLVFYLVLFVAGIAGALQPALFWLLPLGLLAFGAPRWISDTQRLWRRHGRQGMRPYLPRSITEALAMVLIAVSLLAIYVQILTPDNVCYDSRWYHIPIAEQYVAAGGIHKFNEGWYLGTYPQMASLIYAWAYLAPGNAFDHITLCSHVEFSLLIATLLGFSAMVARLLGHGRVLYAGAAIFLFHSMFIYDSSFVTNADHILAFWVSPLTIALVRLQRRFCIREALLTALFTSAAICVKYQSIMLLVPVSLYMAWLVVRHRRILPACVWVATIAAITSTHWLKNAVYYHDPLYPLLHRYLPTTPFHATAEADYRRIYWDPAYTPKGFGWTKFRNMVHAVATFPFTRHARPVVENNEVPTIGALFVLLLPAVPFLRHRVRLVMLAVGVYIGVCLWYLTSHQDRYLQALVPWMAGCVAVTLIQLWQFGALVRGAMSLLVALQLLIVFNGYFMPSHAMTGGAAIRASTEFLAGPHLKKSVEWRAIDKTMDLLSKALPRGAKVLTHAMRIRMGLRAQSVTDEPGWQGAIEYLDLDTPERVAGLWRQLGITHILTKPEPYGSEPTNLGRELVYLRALRRFTTPLGEPIHGWQIQVLLSDASATDTQPSSTQIGWVACRSHLPPGIYAPRALELGPPAKTITVDAMSSDPLGQLAEANALIVRVNCPSLTPDRSLLERQFQQVAETGEFQLWLRR